MSLTYRRAVSITDSTVGIYWAKVNIHTKFDGHMLLPGTVLIVDTRDESWDTMTDEEFGQRWVDEADCARNEKAMSIIRALPESFDDWLDAQHGPAPEVHQ